MIIYRYIRVLPLTKNYFLRYGFQNSSVAQFVMCWPLRSSAHFRERMENQWNDDWQRKRQIQKLILLGLFDP
jgi:hypothetical protein